MGGSRADRLRAAEWALSVTGRSVFKCLRVTSLPKCQIRERGRLRLLQSSAFTSNNLQQQWRNLSRSNCAGQVRTVSKQKFVSQRLNRLSRVNFSEYVSEGQNSSASVFIVVEHHRSHYQAGPSRDLCQ